MTNKTKIAVSNILIITGFLCLVAGCIVLMFAKQQLVPIIVLFAIGVVLMFVGGYFWLNSNHPKVEKKPETKSKPKTNKPKNTKKPFMSEKEWQEQEEEDDEMMFIDEN